MPIVSNQNGDSDMSIVADHFVDLEKLNMWRPLQDLLLAPSSTDDLKMQVIWILGTAVQNNPAAQNAVRLPHLSVEVVSSMFA